MGITVASLSALSGCNIAFFHLLRFVAVTNQFLPMLHVYKGMT
jgi:hypothetical protein